MARLLSPRGKVAAALIPQLLACIRSQRRNPVARPLVREAILRVRQLRGVLELEGK
jgi:hypothetical protein